MNTESFFCQLMLAIRGTCMCNYGRSKRCLSLNWTSLTYWDVIFYAEFWKMAFETYMYLLAWNRKIFTTDDSCVAGICSTGKYLQYLRLSCPTCGGFALRLLQEIHGGNCNNRRSNTRDHFHVRSMLNQGLFRGELVLFSKELTSLSWMSSIVKFANLKF